MLTTGAAQPVQGEAALIWNATSPPSLLASPSSHPAFLQSGWPRPFPPLLTWHHPDFCDSVPSACEISGSLCTLYASRSCPPLPHPPQSPGGPPQRPPDWVAPAQSTPPPPPLSLAAGCLPLDCLHSCRMKGLSFPTPPTPSSGLMYVYFRLPTTWGNENANPTQPPVNSPYADNGTFWGWKCVWKGFLTANHLVGADTGSM